LIRFIFLILFTALILNSCIEPPTKPLEQIPASADNGVCILCEGLWGMDNATLSRYNLNTGMVENNIYSKANQGLKLGDLASDFVVWGNIALISVTTTHTIEKIDLKSGKSLGRIIFPNKHAPRKIAIINDSLAAVTDLHNHFISFFNPYSLHIIKDSIPVGPAPEGLAVSGQALLVVNSGYGDYLANKPKASTVSVISINSMREIGNFYVAPNPIEILINKKQNTIYISYNNLPSLKDSLGGIVQFDLTSLKETARIRTNVRSMTLTSTGDTLLFISDSTVSFIDLSRNFEQQVLIRNSKPKDIWYSLACTSDGTILVGNAKNYQISGELLIFPKGKYTLPTKRYKLGSNPNKIVLY